MDIRRNYIFKCDVTDDRCEGKLTKQNMNDQ